MSTITINMDERKEFFAGELGQTLLKEMSKSDSFEILEAVVTFEKTPKKIIADIAKRLIVTESSKLDKHKPINEDYIRVVVKIAQNKITDKNTLDEIYEFAMKLKEEYPLLTIPGNCALAIMKGLAIHPNTSEETLHNIKKNGNKFDNNFAKLIVKNPSISDEWLIELVEHGIGPVREAAIPELVRRLKEKL